MDATLPFKKMINMDTTHIDALTITIAGVLISMLLGIISFFLSRLLGQFDALRTELSTLNTTMTRIDKDLSGDVGILKGKIEDLDTVWDRIRGVEQSVVSIQSGGCSRHNNCKL